MKKFYLFVVCIAFLKPSVQAQQKLHGILKGQVVDALSEAPLAGVTCLLKKSGKGTSTDVQGHFSLDLGRTMDTLRVSSLGYQAQNIVVPSDGSQPLIVRLAKTGYHINEVIVSTGYQNLPQERAAGSFTHIDNQMINLQTGSNILDRLEGVASSVAFDNNTNRPPLTIRGLSTINGPTSPLIVLDNFPYEGDINNINPNDVESITILKDAAAASIWGTRAGNGVIVITTKKGVYKNPMQLSFNANITLGDKPDLDYLRPMSSSDFIGVEEMLFQKGYYAADEASLNRPPLTPVIETLIAERDGKISSAEAKASINKFKHASVIDDFNNYVYQQSVNQQYALSLQGGSSNMTYYISGGYDHNVDNLSAGYRKVNLSANNTFKPFKNLDISTSLHYTQSESNNGKPSYGSIFLGSGFLYPYAQLADENGDILPLNMYRKTYTDTAGGGSLLDWNYYPLSDYKHNTTHSNLKDMVADIGVRYKLLKGMEIALQYRYESQQRQSVNLQDTHSFAVRDLINRFTRINPDDGSLQYAVPKGDILNNAYSQMTSYDARGQLNYSRVFGPHRIVALAGLEVRQAKAISNNFRIYGYDDELAITGIVDPVNPYQTFPTGGYAFIPAENSAGETLNRFTSTFGNVAYTFKDKYTFSGSARKDASNLFGVKANQKGVPLWSTGLSWWLSKEPFYHWDFLPQLKFRISYGFSGNVDHNQAAVTTLIYFGEARYTNFLYSNVNHFPNPDLTWEKTGMLNVGIDFGTHHSVVSGSIEYYRKKGLDLIGPSPIDYTTGVGHYITKNVANMKGNGFDLDLNLNMLDHTNWRWNAHVLFNYNTNTVTKYNISSTSGSFYLSDGSLISPVKGKHLYSVISYPWAGLDPATGDPQGILNGKISKDYSEIRDKTELSDLIYDGPSLPPFWGSLLNTVHYRNISLSVNLTYKLGYYFRRPSILYSELFAVSDGDADFDRRWQKPGDEKHTQVPSMIYPANSARDNFYKASQALTSKGDHIRLQFIRIAYTFRAKVGGRWPLTGIQAYFNAANMGVLWKANKYGIDPDYPQALPTPKCYALGLQTNF